VERGDPVVLEVPAELVAPVESAAVIVHPSCRLVAIHGNTTHSIAEAHPIGTELPQTGSAALLVVTRFPIARVMPGNKFSGKAAM
jgi:hypothetical protein